MRFEMATEGIFSWLGRLFAARTSQPGGQPRGPLILMLAIACWLIVAIVVVAAIALLR
jgi:hypothetical protein